MREAVRWEKGDRVVYGDYGRTGVVGNMAEPHTTNILPDGAQVWVLQWWVRWDDADQMSKVWGSDLSPALESVSVALERA